MAYEMDTETGYIEDVCICNHQDGQRVDADNCPEHGDNPDAVEALENKRAIAATLPTEDQCEWGETWEDSQHWTNRKPVGYQCWIWWNNLVLFEGAGSSPAAAYGRMIGNLAERVL